MKLLTKTMIATENIVDLIVTNSEMLSKRLSEEAYLLVSIIQLQISSILSERAIFAMFLSMKASAIKVYPYIFRDSSVARLDFGLQMIGFVQLKEIFERRSVET